MAALKTSCDGSSNSVAIPRKGSRKITVKGEEYRWLVRRKATHSQTDYGAGKIHVAIEHAREKGATLHVETDRPHPKDWNTVEVAPVTPADIALWIETAIQKGWDSKKPGPTCRICEE
ncbi:hypothetical protein [Oricola sp.]|uniref:hypothetical protein n=1 Tax=Oricola sp. TaxID=1979950 RepID=UPI0025F96603|nr:hypothetical protein [Oricola sp.]MCI5078502.1 hypothetical protein [Oricola sp.]